MKQIIEIEVPEGKKAIWKSNKIVFEDIKSQLPKTWSEFCKLNPTINTEYFFDNGCDLTPANEGTRHEENDRNILPSKQAAEAHLALMQLHQLRYCYRQGWIPNLIEGSIKYCIIGYYISNTKSMKYRVDDLAYTSNFLSFPTYELAEEFLTNFRELIEQTGDLI